MTIQVTGRSDIRVVLLFILVDCSLLPPQELQVQLQTALKEVDNLREARERQKEMVFAVVKQRDMYRTLLAQSTPLPAETTQQTPG